MKLSEKLLSFWFFILMLGAVGLGLAIYVYRLKFGGGLSADAANWSTFGSYAGGVFSPLISFLTLLAVLKTVYLQRELLSNQVKEFIKLDDHQKLAYEKQTQQLELAKSELEMAKAQAFLSTQLQFIESLKDHFRREADGLAEGVKLILEKGGYTPRSREAADEALTKKQAAEQKIADLVGIAMELSMMDYSTVGEIRKACSLKILKVMYDVDYLKEKGLV